MVVARLLSFALGVVFAWAALSKVLDLGAWKQALAGYALPDGVRSVALFSVPATEAVIAAGFFGGQTRVAAACTLALVAVFSLAILRARAARGSRLPCGCFGSLKERDYRTLLARNTVLGLAAGALLVYGRDVPGYPPAPSGDAWVPATLVAVGVVLALWLLASVRGIGRDVR